MRMLTTLTPEKASSGATPEAATTAQPKSPWHSPVPYLFGGLAAMLGLIAFALLILACSYWKLSREDGQPQSNEARDLESGEKGDDVSKVNGVPVFEEKIVVIMAGNDKPTFLATPLMLSTSKSNFDDDHDDDDDDHHHHDHDHVIVGSSIAKDDGAKAGTSVRNDDDDDDEKAKEDETTHPSHN